mmetsp:Transcript_141999/g.261089  ORF Transcript_141999/g.261089 Transcript_141999/m.261089 type:complete len:98 (+) Transcript_141999:103-396(+)
MPWPLSVIGRQPHNSHHYFGGFPVVCTSCFTEPSTVTLTPSHVPLAKSRQSGPFVFTPQPESVQVAFTQSCQASQTVVTGDHAAKWPGGPPATIVIR